MLPRPQGSFRLFRLFGIDVYLHWAWFLLVAFEVYFRSRYSSVVWAFVEILSVFGLVLMHEFGHALACRSVGGRADRIVLWLLGGVAFVQPPRRPGAVLWSIAAGPLVNVVLLPITVAVFVMVAWDTPMDQWSNWQQYAAFLLGVNAILLFFNMLPIYPLDGGQILHALLWFAIGQARSLRIVAVIGLVAAVCLGVLAVSIGALMLIIVAVFIGMQAWQGYQIAKALSEVEAMEAAEAARLDHLRELAGRFRYPPPDEPLLPPRPMGPVPPPPG